MSTYLQSFINFQIALTIGIVVSIVFLRVHKGLALWLINSRKKIYSVAVYKIVAFDGEVDVNAIKPQSGLDRMVVEKLLLSELVNIKGKIQKIITKLMEQLGFVDRRLRQLSSWRKWRRAYAAKILGDIKTEMAVEPLIRLLEDRAQEVVMSAIISLGKINDKRAIPSLIKILETNPEQYGLQIVEVLIDMGQTSVDPLLKILKSPNEKVRYFASEALGEIKDMRSGYSLLELVDDPSFSVRGKVAKAFGNIGDPRTFDSLVKLLNDKSWIVRREAVRALGKVGGDKVFEHLDGALHDVSWEVKIEAAETLDQIGWHAFDFLISLLEDKDPLVREQSAETLASYGVMDDLIRSVEFADPHREQDIMRTLRLLGQNGALTPLYQGLDSPSDKVRNLCNKILNEVRK
jgi:HEAT repeat protein